MTFTNDYFLSERLKSGDNKAFDYVMDKYYKQLCAYAFMLVKDRSNAEDIVQNVMVILWIKRKNINPELSLKNYLYTSIHNEFINQCRKSRPITALDEKYFEAVDYVLEENTQNIERLMDLVKKEIDNLPPKCRRIFLLNKKDGLTHVEISEFLNISVKTVEGHITRAFKFLSDKLADKTKPILFFLFPSDINQLKLIMDTD